MRTTIGQVMGMLVALALVGCGEGVIPIDPPTDAGPTDAGPGGCTAASAQGIEVASTDVYGGTPYALGYPPYALDGCRFVYVAPGTNGPSGDLRLRDLATGEETTLASEAEQPRRPTVTGAWVAWEGTVTDKSVIRVKGEGSAVTITGPFDHATEPRAVADAIVFTAWLGAGKGADTDVALYAPTSATLTMIGTGPGQQRFADVSATHVAWADFAEDPDGTFDENEIDVADVVLHDRATGKAETRKREGKQAFPMLGSEGRIAYLDWNLVHPEPKLSAYELRVGAVDAPVELDALVEHVDTFQPYVRPVARGALLEWVAWPSGVATLFRRPADLSAPAVTVPGLDAAQVFGPTASGAITVLGARQSGGPVVIQAFAR